jgi:hypothetical protein
MIDGPVVPSRFDRLVGELGLEDQPEVWAESEPLREWASKNRHFYFVQGAIAVGVEDVAERRIVSD